MAKCRLCIFESKKTKKRFLETTGDETAVKLEKLNKNKKENSWVEKNRPFRLVYCEVYNSRKEAEERLDFLKSEERISVPVPEKIFKMK